MPRCKELTLPAGERAVVHEHLYGDRGLFDTDALDKYEVFLLGNDRPDIMRVYTCNGYYVARGSLVDLDPLQAFKGKKFQDLLYHRLPALCMDIDVLSRVEFPAFYLSDDKRSHVLVVCELAYHHFKIIPGIDSRGWYVFDNCIEQGFEAAQRLIHCGGCRSVACRRIDDREVKLGRVDDKVQKQFRNGIKHLIRACLWPVYLIDDDDRLQFIFQRLSQHKSGLRHGSVYCIDEQEHAVHHGERTLDLTAEVGMSRCIDDVDLIVVVPDRCVLCEYRDAPLALELERVHHPFHDLLIDAENTRLLEHGIYQCRFPMVYMGYNPDVPYFVCR